MLYPEIRLPQQTAPFDVEVYRPWLDGDDTSVPRFDDTQTAIDFITGLCGTTRDALIIRLNDDVDRPAALRSPDVSFKGVPVAGLLFRDFKDGAIVPTMNVRSIYGKVSNGEWGIDRLTTPPPTERPLFVLGQSATSGFLGEGIPLLPHTEELGDDEIQGTIEITEDGVWIVAVDETRTPFNKNASRDLTIATNNIQRLNGNPAVVRFTTDDEGNRFVCEVYFEGDE